MAKTLKEILDPKFIPDILSRMKWGNTPQLIKEPKYVLQNYDIPKLEDVDRVVTTIIRTSLILNGYNQARFCSRGDGKTYIVME